MRKIIGLWVLGVTLTSVCHGEHAISNLSSSLDGDGVNFRQTQYCSVPIGNKEDGNLLYLSNSDETGLVLHDIECASTPAAIDCKRKEGSTDRTIPYDVFEKMMSALDKTNETGYQEKYHKEEKELLKKALNAVDFDSKKSSLDKEAKKLQEQATELINQLADNQTQPRVKEILTKVLDGTKTKLDAISAEKAALLEQRKDILQEVQGNHSLAQSAQEVAYYQRLKRIKESSTPRDIRALLQLKSPIDPSLLNDDERFYLTHIKYMLDQMFRPIDKMAFKQGYGGEVTAGSRHMTVKNSYTGPLTFRFKRSKPNAKRHVSFRAVSPNGTWEYSYTLWEDGAVWVEGELRDGAATNVFFPQALKRRPLPIPERKC